MKRFRGGLVFKALRLCVSLNSRIESNKEEKKGVMPGVGGWGVLPWVGGKGACSGPEAGSYLTLIDSCITQLKAQGPSRTCNESKEEEGDAWVRAMRKVATPCITLPVSSCKPRRELPGSISLSLPPSVRGRCLGEGDEECLALPLCEERHL